MNWISSGQRSPWPLSFNLKTHMRHQTFSTIGHRDCAIQPSTGTGQVSCATRCISAHSTAAIKRHQTNSMQTPAEPSGSMYHPPGAFEQRKAFSAAKRPRQESTPAQSQVHATHRGPLRKREMDQRAWLHAGLFSQKMPMVIPRVHPPKRTQSK